MAAERRVNRTDSPVSRVIKGTKTEASRKLGCAGLSPDKSKSEKGGRIVLEGGVLSRVDDMVVIRGVNVYPSAIEAVIRQFPEVVEYMVEQKKVDAMDEIEILIEASPAIAPKLIKRLESRLRDTFSLRIAVQLAEAGSLPRHEFKAKRWRCVGSR